MPAKIKSIEMIKNNLHKAVKKNDVKTIASLIQAGIDINLKNDHGYTALHIALLHGHMELVQYLITHGANINGKAPSKTPLWLACKLNKLNAVKILISAGATLYEADPPPPMQLIHMAAMQGDIDILKYVLTLEINIDAKDTLGRTPLMLAYGKDNIQVANHLISAGASPHERTLNEEHVIHYAAKTGDIQSLQYLFTVKDIHPNIEDSSGQIVLHWALYFNSKALEYLLSLPDININKTDTYGYTPLHIAVDMGNLEAIKLLCRAKALLDTLNDSGETPLHLAAGLKNFAAVKLLCQAGAKLNIQNKEGNTALHIAAKLDTIIQYGSNQFKIIRMLCEHGADPHINNKEGKDAYQMTLQKGLPNNISAYLWTHYQKTVDDLKAPYSPQLKWYCNFSLFALPVNNSSCLPQTLGRTDEMDSMLALNNKLINMK